LKAEEYKQKQGDLALNRILKVADGEIPYLGFVSELSSKVDILILSKKLRPTLVDEQRKTIKGEYTTTAVRCPIYYTAYLEHDGVRLNFDSGVVYSEIKFMKRVVRVFKHFGCNGYSKAVLNEQPVE
jgi:hypothetical protein